MHRNDETDLSRGLPQAPVPNPVFCRGIGNAAYLYLFFGMQCGFSAQSQRPAGLSGQMRLVL